MKINFIRNSYTRFYNSHKKEINDALNRSLSKGSLIAESEVEKLEKDFAKFCKRKYCITVASGTDALILASNIGKMNPLNAYRYRLPKEILSKSSDIALVTYMNSVSLSKKDIDGLRKNYKLIVEDACQAAGQPLYGDISCFSFYPAKMFGGMGKGGALVTNNKSIYLKLKAIRDDKWNNIWLDEVNAAFLNVKLKYLPELLKKRHEIANYYNYYLPKEIIFNEECLQNYIVIVKNPDKFIKFMRSNGIEAISDVSNFYEGNIKGAVRLPMYAELTLSEVRDIINTVNEFYGQK